MDREGEGLPSPNLKTQCRENASQLHLFLLFALHKFRIIPKLCRVRAPLFNNQQSVSLDRSLATSTHFTKSIIKSPCFSLNKGQLCFLLSFCLCFLNTNMRPCSFQQVYISKSSPAALPSPPEPANSTPCWARNTQWWNRLLHSWVRTIKSSYIDPQVPKLSYHRSADILDSHRSAPGAWQR